MVGRGEDSGRHHGIDEGLTERGQPIRFHELGGRLLDGSLQERVTADPLGLADARAGRAEPVQGSAELDQPGESTQ